MKKLMKYFTLMVYNYKKFLKNPLHKLWEKDLSHKSHKKNKFKDQ